MARKRKQPRREEEEEEDTSFGLPTDIFQSILARVPVKSLLRSKAVAKFWNTTISSQYFAKIQAQIASSSSPSHFLVWDRHQWSITSYGSFSLLKFEGEGFHHDSVLGIPFGYADILCACNGIILLRCIFQHPEMHVLWNPCTRVHSKIWWSGDRPAAHGLCHDPTTDDYKVVIITRSKRYSVFSCKERAWTKRKIVCPDYKTIRDVGVYVDGAFYWLCWEEDNYKGIAQLVRFDGKYDKCEKLQLPEPLKYFFFDATLTTLKGCLGLIYVCPTNPRTIQIWRMERRHHGILWRQLMGVASHVDMCVSIREPCPITHNLLMIFIDQSRFIIYDVCEERHVGHIQMFPILWSWKIVPCQHHLFFPVQQNIRPRRRCNRVSYTTFASYG